MIERTDSEQAVWKVPRIWRLGGARENRAPPLEQTREAVWQDSVRKTSAAAAVSFHEPACSAGFPACGFTGLSSPVDHERATGKSPEPAEYPRVWSGNACCCRGRQHSGSRTHALPCPECSTGGRMPPEPAGKDACPTAKHMPDWSSALRPGGFTRGPLRPRRRT
jgi:hypothetical protein